MDENKYSEIFNNIAEQFEWMVIRAFIKSTGNKELCDFMDILIEEGCPVNVLVKAITKFGDRIGDDKK